MTTTNNTLEELQQELEALKLQKQIDELKAGTTPEPSTVGSVEQKPTQKEVKLAAVRQVICGFSHGLFGPLSSLYYGCRTGYFIPTLAATGVFALSVPVALIDFGFTAAVAPPITSAALFISKSGEARRKMKISVPEQADAMITF